MRNNNTQQGFTLLEAVMYIGLFSIIIGGLLMVSYGIIEGSAHQSITINETEEKTFLLQKVNSLLVGAQEILSPPLGDSGSELSFTKSGDSKDPYTINEREGKLYITNSGKEQTPLHNLYIKVVGLRFERLPVTAHEEKLITKITINNEQFEIVKFLAK